jgi:hypothetical protein
MRPWRTGRWIEGERKQKKKKGIPIKKQIPDSMASKEAPRPLEILISGAGIGGLVAAISLRQVGHRVQVSECDVVPGRYNMGWSLFFFFSFNLLRTTTKFSNPRVSRLRSALRL